MFESIITFIIIILTSILSVIYGIAGWSEYKGPQSLRNGGSQLTKIENEKSKVLLFDENMERALTSLTRTMSPELKSEYKKLFRERYLAPAQPPVVTFDDIKHSLRYELGTKVFRPAPHIGQRKLFLTELQFLTDELEKIGDQNTIGEPDENQQLTHTVVYAGAAPSNHTGFLSDLFPYVKFILIDPNPFDIYHANPTYLWKKGDPSYIGDSKLSLDLIKQANEGIERLYIINDIFTQEIADAIASEIPKSYFISDIRTNPTKGSPDANDILWNLAQQYNWMCSMKPIKSMLKFRHPFYAEDPDDFNRLSKESPRKEEFELAKKNGIDFVKNFNKRELVYWDGKINLQAWPGHSSTESRLITTSEKIKDYGTAEEYDNRYFYYNTIDRSYGLHHNDNADKSLGFDYCNDCSLENHLWKNYLQKHKSIVKQSNTVGNNTVGNNTVGNNTVGNNTVGNNTVKQLVAKLSKITYRNLHRDQHGNMFARYSGKELLNLMKEREQQEKYGKKKKVNTRYA